MADFPVLNPRRFEIEKINIDKNQIISTNIKNPGLTENFKGPVNLKNFLNELYDVLQQNPHVRFLDMLGTDDNKKIGDFLDGQAPLSMNATATTFGEYRNGIMYENHFTWTNLKGGGNEVEVNWSARAPLPHSKYAWMEFELDLVNRAMFEKEIDVGGKKMKAFDGKWEFRNKMTYKNNFILKSLRTTPIVKDNQFLSEMYLNYLYYQKVLDDIQYCQKILKPLIYTVLAKHFNAPSRI